MDNKTIGKAIKLLTREVEHYKTPYVTEVSARSRDPFKVLISCILSLRTKDATTAGASTRLFALAGDALAMSALPVEAIERAIYPAGFYRKKAVTIKELSRVLAVDYDSKVPDTIEELLKFNGVGRKTANLVVTMGYAKPGICVDTHVHRITNRWGYVKTAGPEATEFALRQKLPRKYWIPINDLLVTFGQNVCRPVSPLCSKCCIIDYCDRVGVKQSR